MRLGELRKVVPERTTIWVEEAETGNHLTANENKFLNDEFDNSEVVSLFPERYRANIDYSLGDVVRVQKDSITTKRLVSGINMWQEVSYGEEPILNEFEEG